jgi:hypothetical protein
MAALAANLALLTAVVFMVLCAGWRGAGPDLLHDLPTAV